MNIVIMGPQGSGKGTQAKLISEKYSISHISTGEMFREIAGKDTELGKTVRSLINSGAFVPDNIVMEILEKRLKGEDCKNGFILDGVPRSIKQAKILNKITKINFVIELKVSDKTGIKRLSSRRQCKKCEAIYGLDKAPKVAGKCDKCGGELYQREDDKEEIIKKRLEVYHKETEPLVYHYRKQGILYEVNGEQEPLRIFKDIQKILAARREPTQTLST